ncbi:hypothetical protein DSUL_50189 [Desulfovibrionales bacterium]
MLPVKYCYRHITQLGYHLLMYKVMSFIVDMTDSNFARIMAIDQKDKIGKLVNSLNKIVGKLRDGRSAGFM